MSVFFTSDLHFGHEKVALIRGFDDIYEHDIAVMEAWCSVVKPKDQVWVLGDIAVSNPSAALTILAALPGEKHLIWGNHDQGHPMHRDSHRKGQRYTYPAFRDGGVFASAQAFARRKVGGFNVLLSHFPYTGDTATRNVDRHQEYRLADYGLPIIHGHTHSARPWSTSGDDTPQIHVGLDARNLTPVSLDQVAGELEACR